MHLILDERKQRADDQRDAIAEKGWQLIAQALAASRWDQAQGVSALQGAVDDLPL